MATPVTAGIAQSGEPSSPTTQTWPLPQWTRSQGSAVHSPVEFRHCLPAGHGTAEHGEGRQALVETSQNEPLSQLCGQGAFVQAPCMHTWDLAQVTPAQLGTQSPALQN